MSIKSVGGSLGLHAGIGAVAKTQPKPEAKHIETPSVQKSPSNPSEALAAKGGVDNAQLQKLKLSAKAEGKIQDSDSPLSKLHKIFENSGIGKPLIFPVSKEAAETVAKSKNLLDQARSIFDTARNKAFDTVYDLVDVAAGKVLDPSTLKENDSIKIGGKGSLSGEIFGGGLETSYEIKRSPNDPKTGEPEYVIGFDTSPSLSAGLGDLGVSVSAGAKMEYKFKSPEDVEKFMRLQGKLLQGPALSLLNPLTKEEAAFLKDHISTIELKKGAGVSFDQNFGIGEYGSYGISPEAKLQDGLKIEFENGKPVSLVRTTEVSLSGSDKIGGSFEKLGGVPLNSFKLNGGSEYKGTITVETKVPLDQSKAIDIAELMFSPISAAQKDQAETTIKVAVEKDDGLGGIQGEVEVSNLSGKEARQIFGNLVTTDPNLDKAFEGVKVDLKTKVSSFQDRGINTKVDLDYKNIGVAFDVQAERRSVKTLHQLEKKDWGF